MTTALVDPSKVIAQGAPDVIPNDREIELYTNALLDPTALENLLAYKTQAIATAFLRERGSRSG